MLKPIQIAFCVQGAYFAIVFAFTGSVGLMVSALLIWRLVLVDGAFDGSAPAPWWFSRLVRKIMGW